MSISVYGFVCIDTLLMPPPVPSTYYYGCLSFPVSLQTPLSGGWWLVNTVAPSSSYPA